MTASGLHVHESQWRQRRIRHPESPALIRIVLSRRDDQPLAMRWLVGRQRAPLAVLRPLLADMVTADAKVPDRLRHTAKPGRRRVVQPDNAFDRRNLLEGRFGWPGALGDRLVELRGFHQVQGEQLGLEGGDGMEKCQATGRRNAGEVDFQESGVAPSKCGLRRLESMYANTSSFANAPRLAVSVSAMLTAMFGWRTASNRHKLAFFQTNQWNDNRIGRRLVRKKMRGQTHFAWRNL